MDNQTFGQNEALITYTCLANADGFLANLNRARRDSAEIVGFFDLLNVIESAVWYDHLWFVSGMMPPQFEDGDDSGHLSTMLIDAGVLREAEPDKVDDLTKETVAQWVMEATKRDNPKVILLSPDVAYRVAAATVGIKTEDELSSATRSFRLQYDRYPPFLETGMSTNEIVTNEPSLENLAITIARQIAESATGCAEEGASLIRTVFYWTLAQNRRLGLCVEGTRISTILGLFRSAYQSVGRELYLQISKAFECALEELLSLEHNSIMYLPPLGSLVLDRCAGPNDLSNALLSVRREMASLRDQIKELEADRAEAKTLKDLASTDRRFQEWLREFSKQFDYKAEQGFVERGLPVVGDLIKPLAKPDDLVDFTAKFASKPLEWVRKWWIQRPVSCLFDLKGKLFNIGDYSKLAESAFGVTFSEGDVWQFRRYAAIQDKIPFARLETFKPGHYWRWPRDEASSE